MIQFKTALSAAFCCALLTSVAIAQPASLAPYELNAVVPLTGGGAFLGKSFSDTFHAIELTVNASGGINGHPLKIIVSDSQTNGQTDVQLVNGLIAKRVAVFIDGGPSNVCLSSIPLLEKTGPVDYCLTPAIHPSAGSFVFSVSAATSDVVAVAMRYLRERGWKQFATITSTDATGQDYDRQVASVLAVPENREMKLVAEEHFNSSDISVTAQAARLKNASPKAVFVFTTGSALGTVLRGLNDVGLDAPVITLPSNMTYAQMSAYSGFAPKDLYFPALRLMTPEGTLKGPLRDAEASYLEAFHQLGIRPDNGDVLAWDPTLLIVDALRHLGTGASATQIRDYILHLHGWIGANGVYDFSGGDQRGLSQNSIVVARWSAAQGRWVQESRPRGFLKTDDRPAPR
jgi:branched-chain amino acid transport system substrate-binding protein